MESLTQPSKYRLRLIGDDSRNGAVLVIDPLSTARASVDDSILGAQSATEKCDTCGGDVYHCPGHLAAFKVYPIPVPIAWKSLVSWLSVACVECGRIGIDHVTRRNLRLSTDKITFRSIRTSIQAKGNDYLCPFCSFPFRVLHPVGYRTSSGGASGGASYNFDRPALFHVAPVARSAESAVVRSYHELAIFDNYHTWDVLKKASKEDCEMMGWNPINYHPRHFMWDHVPIAPPAVRPKASATSKNIGLRSKKLHGLVRDYQIMVGNALGGRTLEQLQSDLAREKEVFDRSILSIFHLYYAVAVLQTHLPDTLSIVETREFKLGSQKGNTSYEGRMGSKQGLFRRNASGTRHDVNIRTPLIAFPGGAIGTATCPMNFAMKIGIQRRVTPDNIEWMRTLVRNGPHVYPGANAYIHGGVQFSLAAKDCEAVAASLIPGDIIVRHVLTGDIALHQRYPSIREESIHAVSLVVTSQQLVAIPLAVCAKMMADFDGDDTELFFLSSDGVAAESLYLLSSIRQLMAPDKSKPCIATGGDAGTDTPAGIATLIRRGKFDQRDINTIFANLFTNTPVPTGKEAYTIEDIFGAILPRGFYYDARSRGDTVMGDLLIEGGKVVRGEMTSKGVELGAGAPVLGALYTNLDPYSSIKVLEDFHRIAYAGNSIYGISSADNMRVPPDVRATLDKLVKEQVDAINTQVNLFHRGQMVVPIGQNPLDHFEQVVLYDASQKNAAKINDILTSMLKGTAFDRHNYIRMFKARLSPALATRGHVIHEGHRLRPILDHGNRHTAWYPKGYDGADAGGYTANAFIQRIPPPAFFNEAIPAREQLFIKGRGLAKQGYLNRKMSVSMNCVHVGYFGEVRGHSKTILDFTYGTLGSDSHHSIPTIIDDHLISDTEFRARHGEVQGEFETLLSIRTKWRDAIVDYAKVTSDENFSPANRKVDSCIDIRAIILSHVPGKGVLHQHSISPPQSSHPSKQKVEGGGQSAKLSRTEMWNHLQEMYDRFVSIHIGKRAGAFIRRVVNDRVDAFMRTFRFICCTHYLSSLGEWNASDLESMLSTLLYRYATSMVPVGDMVGMKAGLNVVAPQTQAQLHAIRGGKEVKGTVSNLKRTGGTTLFQEKVEGLNPSAPLSSFILRGTLGSDKRASLEYAKRLSSIHLEEVMINAWLISVAPEEMVKCGEDCGMNKLLHYLSTLPPTLRKAYEQSRKSWFYIVIHLDTFALLACRADITTIGTKLQEQYPNAISFVVTIYGNEDGLFLFVSMIAETMDLLKSYFHMILEEGTIHGYSAFTNGTVVTYTGTPSFDEDGSMKETLRYRIFVNGCDLHYLYAQGEIEPSTIYTTNVIDSINYFGIEEGRFRAYEDMLFEGSRMDDLKGILPRHMKTLADFMAYRGRPTFLPRFSMGANPDIDTLDKMTFETPDVFLSKALTEAKWRKIESVIPCTVFGVQFPYGSTISDVLFRASDMKPPSEAADRVMDDISTKIPSKEMNIRSSSIQQGRSVERRSHDIALPMDVALGLTPNLTSPYPPHTSLPMFADPEEDDY